MSLPAVVDIEAILSPISPEQPGGIDPRESTSANSPYYRVKDARNAARAEERGATEVDAPVPEAWDNVVEFGVELLATQAKDLEVASWLTEALIRTQGFAGLRDGLTVIGRLVSEFWDHLYPMPDEDGIETRVSPVAGLGGSGATGTLDQPIRRASLTDGSGVSYSFWTYEQAVDFEKIKDEKRRQARIAAGTVTLDAFRKSVNDTPADDLLNTLHSVTECEAALTSLSAALDAAAGDDSPPVSPLQDLLSSVAGCLRHVAGDRLAALAQQAEAAQAAQATPAVDAQSQAADAAEGVSSQGSASVAARRPGEFGNREEALAQLVVIANYFRRSEPQSPLAYTLDDAVRRARLSLQELLIELAQDPAHVQHILTVAGISVKEAVP